MLEEQISKLLKNITSNNDWNNYQVTAQYLSTKFNVKRNTVSHYLNDLFKKGQAVKINSRPVIFWDKKILEDTYQIKLQNEYSSVEELTKDIKKPKLKDSFSQVIGSKESLLNAIQKIKVAAGYPPIGLPILLTGPTGAGKSFLAQKYYEYCLDQGYLSPRARFIHFNCAEYADNPELLTSNLFGYKKGAFTGAISDKRGLFDEADGGMLFLDEVHRLDAKGQEKLFRYLDSGKINPLGETQEGHQIKTRLIFATTEDVKSHFIETFIRRIPIQINIPKLNDRLPQEKENLIKLFYLQQAKKINKIINLSLNVIKLLSSAKYQGNVGELQNTILISVANALQNKKTLKNELTVVLSDIPMEILRTALKNSSFLTSNNEYLKIKPEDTIDSLAHHNNNSNQKKKYFLKIFSKYSKLGNKPDFIKQANSIINSFCDNLIFDKASETNTLQLDLFKDLLTNELNNIESSQQIKINGNSVLVLSHYYSQRESFNWQLNKKEEKLVQNIIDYIDELEPDIHNLIKEIVMTLANNLNVYSTQIDELFVYLYLKSIIKESERPNINCLVLAHGYSTASSIANVVNNIQNGHWVDSIDMPLDIDIKNIGQQVNNYIQNRHISTGLILMVDMGSLEGIKKYIDESIDFPIVIINNVSTQSVLLVSQHIRQQHELNEILNEVNQLSLPKIQIIYPKEVKRNLIITCCLTGVGTAKQIKKLLTDSLPVNLNIEVKAVEFNKLKDQKNLEVLAKVYNIISVVGTVNPNLSNIPYISLESIISGKQIQEFNQILSHYLTYQQLKKFNDELIHNFSLERVINSITILDVNVVMRNIDKAIRNFISINGKTLSSVTRMSLYVHVSCLIERLIRNDPITTYDMSVFSDTKEKKLFNQIKKSFSVIEEKYSVTIPDHEYGYIFDIIAAD